MSYSPNFSRNTEKKRFWSKKHFWAYPRYALDRSPKNLSVPKFWANLGNPSTFFWGSPVPRSVSLGGCVRALVVHVKCLRPPLTRTQGDLSTNAKKVTVSVLYWYEKLSSL